jgi:histidinol-phosphate aminotransferase
VIPIPATIAGLPHYDPPALDRSPFLRLDLNECTQPLPLVVQERIAAAIGQAHLYPSPRDFHTRLAAYTGAPAECHLATNGSDQGIDLILRGLLSPGDEMLIARPEFAMFNKFALLNRVVLRGVPLLEDFAFPYDGFANAIMPATKMIAIINPNNPTGTPVRREFIAELLEAHPSVPILVDEAYYEYSGETVVDLLPKFDNLVVLRTFSKGFAMAGLRLGYIVARPESIAALAKCRGPFDVNRLAIAAGTAQLENVPQALAHVHEVMAQSKPYIESFWRAKGVPFTPGAANFLLVAHPERDALINHLLREGILVRPLAGPRLDGHFRMGLGTLAEMKRFTEAVERFPAS